MAVPEIRYARDGDLNIAYQTWGSGPIDLVFVWGTFSHCELMWEDPDMAAFLESLGRFARVVQFDKRGTGMSDAIAGIPSLEERMDDVRIVMAAAGMERAVLFGESEGGPMSCLFAATYPERVSKLVLFGPLLRLHNDDDFQGGWEPDEFAKLLDTLVDAWGSGTLFTLAAPSRSDPFAAKLGARFERFALTRGAFRQLMEANAASDVRPVLPLITQPTLVMHRVRDGLVSVVNGRGYAQRIAGSEYVELEGGDHLISAGDWQRVVREAERFVAGEDAPSVPTDVDVERVLSTVLFTDIVASTERATSVGDRRWLGILDDHDRIVRQEVERYRGHVVKTTGDGALATFDGPARAVRSAHSIAESVRRLGIEIRAGVHTGEVELRGDDVGGIGVHIGARVSSLAAPSQVLVSRTVVDLVAGSGLAFADAGTHALKGVPGDWTLFALAG